MERALLRARRGLACVPSALASQTIDANVTSVRLAVNAKGEALVTYTRANGQASTRAGVGRAERDRPRRVPSRSSGSSSTTREGPGSTARRATGARSRTSAGRTPVLRFRTALPRAPPRTAPTGGFRSGSGCSRSAASRPFSRPTWPGSCTSRTGRRRSPCSRSRPTGRTAASFQGLFGRLVYEGKPVHGFRTPTRGRIDHNARYVYIDTFDSAYGPGWKRDGAKVTHLGSGGFCYSFAPLARRRPAIRQCRRSRGRESATASPSWARA